MKIHQILETELPIYRDYLKNFDDWLEIKNSGRYNPDKYDGDFDCRKENLPSLIGSPVEVSGLFNCEQNFLRSLQGGPRKVGGVFDCSNNRLTSLEFAPKTIGSIFYATQNQITSLKNIHKQILSIGGRLMYVDDNPITSNILGVLLIKGLFSIIGDGPAFKILQEHARGNKDVLECQEELISAGYKEFAKL